MAKKLVCILLALCCFCLAVSAESGVSLTVGEDFAVYRGGEPSEELLARFHMEKEQFLSLCEVQNLIWCAVDENNQRQIQISSQKTDFSENIGNLSHYADEELVSLMDGLTGSSAVQGTVVKNGGQKFIRTELASADSGGEYTVLRYSTVAGGKYTVLSFLTAAGESGAYAERVFETLRSPDFYSVLPEKSVIEKLIPFLIAGFALLAAVLTVFAVRDFRAQPRSRKEEKTTE